MFGFQLGVNAYGFIVTNNGFILVHPDLRSMVSLHLSRDLGQMMGI
jgi:Cache domain.